MMRIWILKPKVNKNKHSGRNTFLFFSSLLLLVTYLSRFSLQESQSIIWIFDMDQIQEKNSIHFVYTWAYYTHSSGKSAQRDFLENRLRKSGCLCQDEVSNFLSQLAAPLEERPLMSRRSSNPSRAFNFPLNFNPWRYEIIFEFHTHDFFLLIRIPKRNLQNLNLGLL